MDTTDAARAAAAPPSVPEAYYNDEVLLSLLALDLKFKRLVGYAQEAGLSESHVNAALDKVASELVKLYTKNSGLKVQCHVFLKQVHNHFVAICREQGKPAVDEDPDRRLMRIEALEKLERPVRRPRSRSWSGHEPAEKRYKSQLDIDIKAANLENSQALVKESLLMLEQARVHSASRGMHFWREQNVTMAYKELLKAERMSMKLQTLKQQVAIENALKEMMMQSKRSDTVAPTSSSRAAKSPKKKQSVRFADNVSEVVGFADANVDRKPIDVTPSSPMETLMIRCLREFPSVALDCAIQA